MLNHQAQITLFALKLKQEQVMLVWIKMKNIYLLTISLLWILLSCQTEGNFNTRIYTSHEKLLIDQDFVILEVPNERVSLKLQNQVVLGGRDLMNPWRIKVFPSKNLGFVLDGAKKNYITIFDLSSGNIVAEVLSTGLGPNELATPYHLQISEVTNDLQIFGLNPETLMVFNIDELLSNTIEKPDAYHKSLGNINWAFKIDANRIVAANSDPFSGSGMKLMMLDTTSKILSEFGPYPHLGFENFDEKSYNSIHLSTFSMDGTHEFLVQSYMISDLILVYKRKNKEEFEIFKKIAGPEAIPIEIKTKELPNGKLEFQSFTSETKLGYPLQAAVGTKGFIVGYPKNVRYTDDFTGLNTLYYISFEGKILETFSVDVPIYSFDVDWKNGHIFGLTMVNNDPDNEVALLKFEIPNWEVSN
jgi:hypothetical protein